jgi:hypothetical protein
METPEGSTGRVPYPHRILQGYSISKRSTHRAEQDRPCELAYAWFPLKIPPWLNVEIKKKKKRKKTNVK